MNCLGDLEHTQIAVPPPRLLAAPPFSNRLPKIASGGFSFPSLVSRINVSKRNPTTLTYGALQEILLMNLGSAEIVSP